MIVPVYLSHKDHPEKEILVYALLDSQSDTTFVSQATFENLAVQGTKTSLLLSTMTLAKTKIDLPRFMDYRCVVLIATYRYHFRLHTLERLILSTGKTSPHQK